MQQFALDAALRRVTKARQLVDEQRERVAKLKEAKRDASAAQKLLKVPLWSLAAFEADLEKIQVSARNSN